MTLSKEQEALARRIFERTGIMALSQDDLAQLADLDYAAFDEAERQAEQFVKEQLLPALREAPDGGVALLHAVVSAALDDAAENGPPADMDLVGPLIALAKAKMAKVSRQKTDRMRPDDPRWTQIWENTRRFDWPKA